MKYYFLFSELIDFFGPLSTIFFLKIHSFFKFYLLSVTGEFIGSFLTVMHVK